MTKIRGFIAVICFVTFAFGVSFAQSNKDKFEYDPLSPKSVVQAAKEMLIRSDFDSMLKVTEQTEKRKTQQTIDAIKENRRVLRQLQEEAEKLHSFEILEEEVFSSSKGELAVVYTRWQIVRDKASTAPGVKLIEEPGREISKYSTVYVDYLLKQFDGEWKIISQRSR
jgi:hypothetical protein